jgi:hypothetical protein
VDEKSGATGLVHHTLQEYLNKHPEQLLPNPEIQLASVCLTYLSFEDFQSGPCDDGELLDRRLEDYRFLDYASHHWGIHMRASDTELDEIADVLEGFLEDDSKLACSIQVLHLPRRRMKTWCDRFPKQVTPLHVAAYWGLHKIFTKVYLQGDDIDRQDTYGAAALHLAAERGHLHVVQLLLRNWANPNIIDVKGRTALALACRNGHKAVSEVLLEHGAKIAVEDKSWADIMTL